MQICFHFISLFLKSLWKSLSYCRDLTVYMIVQPWHRSWRSRKCLKRQHSSAPTMGDWGVSAGSVLNLNASTFYLANEFELHPLHSVLLTAGHMMSYVTSEWNSILQKTRQRRIRRFFHYRCWTVWFHLISDTALQMLAGGLMQLNRHVTGFFSSQKREINSVLQHSGKYQESNSSFGHVGRHPPYI